MDGFPGSAHVSHWYVKIRSQEMDHPRRRHGNPPTSVKFRCYFRVLLTWLVTIQRWKSPMSYLGVPAGWPWWRCPFFPLFLYFPYFLFLLIFPSRLFLLLAINLDHTDVSDLPGAQTLKVVLPDCVFVSPTFSALIYPLTCSWLHQIWAFRDSKTSFHSLQLKFTQNTACFILNL